MRLCSREVHHPACLRLQEFVLKEAVRCMKYAPLHQGGSKAAHAAAGSQGPEAVLEQPHLISAEPDAATATHVSPPLAVILHVPHLAAIACVAAAGTTGKDPPTADYCLPWPPQTAGEEGGGSWKRKFCSSTAGSSPQQRRRTIGWDMPRACSLYASKSGVC